MRKISRSSHLAFSECMRKGYWGYCWNGTGLSETGKSAPLLIGLTVHKGMELLLLGTTDDTALMDGMEVEWLSHGGPMQEFKDQQNLALAKALVLGWKRCRLDEFLTLYEIISVEREIETQLAPNILLQARADCVTRNKWDGTVWVWNWKTSSSISDWNDQWTYDIQAMTEALAVQESLGEYVQGCVFEGFYKGGSYGGVSTSALVTGYTDGQQWQVGGRSRGGEWRKVSTWLEFPGSTPQWLDLIGQSICESYVRSAPILKDDDQVRDWLRQVVRRETDIQMMLSEEIPEDDRLVFFSKNPGRRCKWCAFGPACWSGLDVSELPLTPRIDHHAGPVPEP